MHPTATLVTDFKWKYKKMEPFLIKRVQNQLK